MLGLQGDTRECVVSQHKLLVVDFRFQVRARRDKKAIRLKEQSGGN